MMEINSGLDIDVHSKLDNYADTGDHSCPDCGRVFSTRQNLATHIRRFHKVEYLTCSWPGCNKQYKHRWDLTSHVKTTHKGEKVLCPHCNSQFSKKSNLHNHLTRGKGCPRARSNDRFNPDARLTRTSSDDREESSETSEIDSGIREEEDSGGENNDSTTVDKRSSPDTEVKNLHDSRKSSSPVILGTNGNSSIHSILLPVTTAQISSSPLYIPQNGAKVDNSSSGDQVMTENEQDSPLYKFLKENRDMLKNMSSSHHRTSPGARDPGCPESPAMGSGYSDSDQGPSQSQQPESYNGRQEVRKGSSNLDLLAEIALNQVSTTSSPPIEESSTRAATENIQISNPLLDLSTKQQDLSSFSGSPSQQLPPTVLQSLQELQLLQNLQEITKARVEKHLAAAINQSAPTTAVNRAPKLSLDVSQQLAASLLQQNSPNHQMTTALPPTTNLGFLSALAQSTPQQALNLTSSVFQINNPEHILHKKISAANQITLQNLQQNVSSLSLPAMASLSSQSLASLGLSMSSLPGSSSTSSPSVTGLSATTLADLLKISKPSDARMAPVETATITASRLNEINSHLLNLSPVTSSVNFSDNKTIYSGEAPTLQSLQNFQQSLHDTQKRQSPEIQMQKGPAALQPIRLEGLPSHLMSQAKIVLGSPAANQQPSIQQPININSLAQLIASTTSGSDISRQSSIIDMINKTSMPHIFSNTTAVNTSNGNSILNLKKEPDLKDIRDVQNLMMLSKLGAVPQLSTTPKALEGVSSSGDTVFKLTGVGSSGDNVYKLATASVASWLEDKKPHQCGQCGRVCSTPAHLNNHIRYVHCTENKPTLPKNIPCPSCDKMFGRQSHLVEHIRTVHEGKKRKYQRAECQHCGKNFARQCSLNQHITLCHSGGGEGMAESSRGES